MLIPLRAAWASASQPCPGNAAKNDSNDSLLWSPSPPLPQAVSAHHLSDDTTNADYKTIPVFDPGTMPVMNGEGPREPETEVSEGGSISSFDASSAIGSFDASSDEEGGNGDSGDSSGTVKSAVPRIAQEITAESAQEGKEHGDHAHQFQGQSARTINAKDTNQGPHPIRSRSAGRLGIFMDFHAHLHEEDKQRRTHNTRLRRTVLFFRGEIEEIQLILQNKRERHRKQIRRRSRQGEK